MALSRRALVLPLPPSSETRAAAQPSPQPNTLLETRPSVGPGVLTVGGAIAALLLFTVAMLAAESGPLRAPDSLRQGEVLRVEWVGGGTRGSVQWNKKTFPLLPGKPGEPLVALVPVPVNQEAGTYTLKAGALTHSFEVLDVDYPRQNIRVSKSMSRLRPLPGELQTIGRLQKTLSTNRHWTDTFVSPTPDCMNSVFGVKRYHNGKYSGRYHKGVDLRSKEGTPVRAFTDGVIRISRKFRLNGGTIGIDHGQGMVSVYIHLSRLRAREGQIVKAGDIIGEVGQTGFATGPHLHWGLYVHRVAVNPDQWTGAVSLCE